MKQQKSNWSMSEMIYLPGFYLVENIIRIFNKMLQSKHNDRLLYKWKQSLYLKKKIIVLLKYLHISYLKKNNNKTI